ncbi:MAG TPA: dihydrolipoamide acetyltransferase family protein [Solirubrobacteraceae bacterium]|nr:dihydrolipoamide acetyltransferase family protein [Solirubrobacteraceae bacterium]
MAEIVMPRLSDTMEEGTILRWLKADGEELKRGEELVEIETDKATMIYESDQSGTLQTVAREGDTLPVGELIARVGVPGDGAAAGGGPAAVEAEAEEAYGRAEPDRPVASPGGDANGVVAPAPDPGVAASAAAKAGAAPAPSASSPGGRVKASPLARRVAREAGVDIASLSGSGPGGRIVRADVQAAASAGATGLSQSPTAAAAAPAPAALPGSDAAPAASPASSARDDVTKAKGETTTESLTRMQQTIARRMAESKATIPDFTLQMDVDMDECVRLRAELKRISSSDAPTYNDMVVKACALALREHPRANGSYKDGALQLHSRINVGVAVAANDALVVPTVFDADTKALGEIARETRALATRVREQSITPPELGGGTFTVSNLGMYGVRAFNAIINPPQAAILSVGSVEQRAVVRDEQIVARQTMTLTLVCDHRILYGADAAELLARIRELLQAPASLTL